MEKSEIILRKLTTVKISWLIKIVKLSKFVVFSPSSSFDNNNKKSWNIPWSRYFNPHYVFPTQEEVIDRVKKIVREKSEMYSKALFVTGTYLIGECHPSISIFLG